jgi:2-polyprenyl-3-methyl-5-hydroxy-6-metoxy-1,4-benzoquinol methylase
MTTQERLTNRELSYHKFAEPWHRFARVIDAMKEVMPEIHGKSLLELGCDVGAFIRVMIDLYGVKATGIDQWNENHFFHVNRYKEDAPWLKPNMNWTYIKRDLSKPLDLDQQFDIVCAMEVIEYLIDTDKFLDQCLHLTKTGGYLILTTPNINSIRNRLYVLAGKYPAHMEYKNIIHHVRLYNVPLLIKHLEVHHFKSRLVRGVNFLPEKMIPNFIFRNISNLLANKLVRLCPTTIVICQKMS